MTGYADITQRRRKQHFSSSAMPLIEGRDCRRRYHDMTPAFVARKVIKMQTTSSLTTLQVEGGSIPPGRYYQRWSPMSLYLL